MSWTVTQIDLNLSAQHRLAVWWIPILIISLLGCIDEIELVGTGGGGDQLVIQGQVIKGFPSIVRVRVSKTADFAVRSYPTAVENAVVFLEDEAGNRYPVPPEESGVYQAEIEDGNPLISIETGKSYSVFVTTAEGSQYKSTLDKLNSVPIADSVSIEIIDREELDNNNQRVTEKYMQFFVHTPLEVNGIQEKARIRWTFEVVYRVDETLVPGPGPGPQTCYVSRGHNLDKVVVFNGNEANSGRLDKFFFAEDEIGVRFGLGYLLRINQHSLSKEAHEYWNKVSQAVALSGGLFEASPGEIVGNMSNIDDPSEQVFGYFYASEEYELTRFVTPDQAGNPEDFCSTDLFSGEQVCLSCLTIPFSTQEIPDDWGQ